MNEKPERFKGHTPGPWQIAVTKHPHYAGNHPHIERRIFTEKAHPQLGEPHGVVNMSIGLGAKECDPVVHMVAISEADAELIAAAPSLLAENERLRGLLTEVRAAKWLVVQNNLLDRIDAALRREEA